MDRTAFDLKDAAKNLHLCLLLVALMESAGLLHIVSRECFPTLACSTSIDSFHLGNIMLDGSIF